MHHARHRLSQRNESTAVAGEAARHAELAAVALDDGRGATARAQTLPLIGAVLVLDHLGRVGSARIPADWIARPSSSRMPSTL